MQKEYTPLPSDVVLVSLYEAGGRILAASPYCDKPIISCGCSIRTPTANALGCITTPCSLSSINVSLALCPVASITASHAICEILPACSYSTPQMRSPCKRNLTKRVSKCTVAPSAKISSRIDCTTSRSLSVPICGFCIYKISSGAPCATKHSSTFRFLPEGSFTIVLSLPSEKVPAPPSPNCTLHSGSSSPVCQK